jgi:hypothetical protein
MLKFWVIALGLVGLLPIASVSQETGGGVVTPSKVLVSVSSSGPLIPGQNFKFILRFDRAPQRYVNGKIQYRFQLTSPVGSEAHPEGNLQALNQSADLLNGVADYSLRLRVTQSMLPGTWRLTEVTIVGGAPHPVQILENVTFEVHESQLPIRAKIQWEKGQRLEDGESFKFGICLETVPEGYDRGGIHYRFALRNPDPHEARSAPPSTLLKSAEGDIGLKDGQSCYESPPVPVFQPGGHFESDFLSLGEWKLLEVTLAGRPVIFQDDVTFEVRAPTIVLHVQAPRAVEAGHNFVFKVSVDGFLQNTYCLPTLSVDLHQLSAGGPPDPNNSPVYVKPISLDPNQQERSFEMSGTFAPDLPAGPWQGEFVVSTERAPEMLDRAPQETCRRPNLEGDTRFAFEVEPAVGLVTPTSVTVTVNPLQVQLLRVEAERLTARANLLKQQLSSEDTTANYVLLRDGLAEVMKYLDTTEAKYKEETNKGVDQSSIGEVSAFFDDIRLDYRETEKVLNNESAESKQFAPRLLLVDAWEADSSPHLTHASAALLKSILRNVKGYEIAASSKSMLFNLDVFSDPQGATISYHQRGKESHNLDHETDWRIENLSRGVYFIKLQKPGYEPNEVEFDAMTSTATSVSIPLRPKIGAK